MGPPLEIEPGVAAMCEVMGGRSFTITSSKGLQQCLENINFKMQRHGVLVTFQPLPRDGRPSQALMPGCPHKMIYIRPNPRGPPVGHWPIPESYWLPKVVGSLPARDAHPAIWFSQEETEPQVVEGIPFDKYELEQSPLTQHILALKRTNMCWLCYVPNSSAAEGPGKPFGYLKPSSAGNCVNLIIMPYDFPALIPLLKDLRSFPKAPFTAEWHQRFVRYLEGIPNYGIPDLKIALVGRYVMKPSAARCGRDSILARDCL